MSREQWGHGYHSGVKDGMKSAVSLYDYIVLKYINDDTPAGDLARDMEMDFRIQKMIAMRSKNDPRRPYSEANIKGGVLARAGSSSACGEIFEQLKHEWEELKHEQN